MPKSRSASVPIQKSFRILVAGESQDTRAIGMLLSGQGNRIVFAASVQETLAKLKKEENLDALVLDLKFSQKNTPLDLRKPTENGKFAGFYIIQAAQAMKRNVPAFVIDNSQGNREQDEAFLRECGVRLCNRPVNRKALVLDIAAALQAANRPSLGAVLVVHEQPAVVELIQLTLEAKGLKVISTDHPETGLELITQHRPAIVIHDFSMPVMDGEEFDRKIREKFGPYDPAIIWTSKTALPPDHARKCRISAWVNMPFEPIDFAFFVEEVLKSMVNEKTGFPRRFKMA